MFSSHQTCFSGFLIESPEAATRGALQKKLLLKISEITQENTSVVVSFESSCRKLQVQGLQLYSKETPTQLFSCEICKIFKSTYVEEHLRITASESLQRRI